MRGTFRGVRTPRPSPVETAFPSRKLYTDQPATRNLGDGEGNSRIRAIDGLVNRPIIGGSVGRNAHRRFLLEEAAATIFDSVRRKFVRTSVEREQQVPNLADDSSSFSQ